MISSPNLIRSVITPLVFTQFNLRFLTQSLLIPFGSGQIQQRFPMDIGPEWPSSLIRSPFESFGQGSIQQRFSLGSVWMALSLLLS